MRNNHRNEGSGFPYEHRPLADQGAGAAKYDGQGSLVALPEKEARVTDRFALFAQALYDHAMNDDERLDEDLAELFEDMGFADLGHQVREGIRHCVRDAFSDAARAAYVAGFEYNQKRYEDVAQFQQAAKQLTASEAHKIVDKLGLGLVPFVGAEGMEQAFNGRARAVYDEEKRMVVWRPIEGEHYFANPPPADHTAQEPFTEEEIAAVRRMKFNGTAFSQMAEHAAEFDGNCFEWKHSPEGATWWYDHTKITGRKKDMKFCCAVAVVDDAEARAKLLRYAAIAEHLAAMEG